MAMKPFCVSSRWLCVSTNCECHRELLFQLYFHIKKKKQSGGFQKTTQLQKYTRKQTVSCFVFFHMFILGYTCRHQIEFPCRIPRGERNWVKKKILLASCFDTVFKSSCASYGLKNWLKEVCALIFRGWARGSDVRTKMCTVFQWEDGW